MFGRAPTVKGTRPNILALRQFYLFIRRDIAARLLIPAYPAEGFDRMAPPFCKRATLITGMHGGGAGERPLPLPGMYPMICGGARELGVHDPLLCGANSPTRPNPTSCWRGRITRFICHTVSRCRSHARGVEIAHATLFPSYLLACPTYLGSTALRPWEALAVCSQSSQWPPASRYIHRQQPQTTV
jgi:hypothetical protein